MPAILFFEDSGAIRTPAQRRAEGLAPRFICGRDTGATCSIGWAQTVLQGRTRGTIGAAPRGCGAPPACTSEFLFWVAGIEGEAGLLFQPPAGVLPAPVCFLGGAAVCVGDPLRVNLYYYDDVSIAFVIVPDQIAGADLRSCTNRLKPLE